jgi:hypothetical protein
MASVNMYNFIFRCDYINFVVVATVNLRTSFVDTFLYVEKYNAAMYLATTGSSTIPFDQPFIINLRVSYKNSSRNAVSNYY